MKPSRAPFKVIRDSTPGPGAYSPREPQKHIPSALIRGRQTPELKKAGLRNAGAVNFTPTGAVPTANLNSTRVLSSALTRTRVSPKTNEGELIRKDSLVQSQRPVCTNCVRKFEKLQSELKVVISAKSVLESTLSVKNDELQTVGVAVSELRAGNLQLAHTNDEMAGRINDFAKRCHDSETLLEEERGRGTKLSNELAERNRQLEDLRSENQRLSSELSARERCITEAERLISAISDKEQQVLQLQAELKRQETEYVAELERLKTELKESNRQLNEQRTELEHLQDDVRAANESVCVCAAEFERACAAADALRAELNENANAIAFYRETLAQKDAELDAVRTQQRTLLDAATDESCRNDEVIDDLRRKLSVLEERSVHDAPESDKGHTEASDPRISELHGENETLRRELAAQRSAMLALQSANAELLRRANERDAVARQLETRMARSDAESAIGSQRSVTDSEFSSSSCTEGDMFAEQDKADTFALAFAACALDKDLLSFSDDVPLHDTHGSNMTSVTCDPSRINATDSTALLLERVETNQRLEQLVRKYAALSQDFAALRDDRETSRALSETYRADCVRLRTQLDTALSRIAELQAAFNRQAEQLDNVNNTLKGSENCRAELEKRVTSSCNELQRVRVECDSEKEKCATLESQLARQQNAYQAEVAHCRSVCEARMNACVREMETLSLVMREQQNKINELIEQLTDAQAEIDALEASHQQLTTAKSALQRECDTLRRRVPSESGTDALKQKATELERRVEELTAERTSLNGLLSKKDGELAMLVTLSEKLGGELRMLKGSNAELNAQVDKQRAELSRLRRSYNELRTQIAPFSDVLRAFALERRALSERTNANGNCNSNAGASSNAGSNSGSPRVGVGVANVARKSNEEKLRDEMRKLTQRYAKMIVNEKHRQRFQNVMAISSRQAGLQQENERLRNEIANLKLRSNDTDSSGGVHETSI